MKKAFITGITGQDGSYLAELLLDKDYEVHGLIRRTSNPNTRNIRRLLYDEDIFNRRFFLHDGDLMDTGSLYRIINKVEPDEIYNLGAMAGVGPSFYQPDYALETNGNVVGRILEAVKFLNPKIKFFQAGSSHIFGDTKETPQTENTTLQPISPYAIGKALGQNLVRYYREVHGLLAYSAIFYAHISPRYSESFLLGKIIHSVWRILRGEQRILELGNLEVPSEYGYAKDFMKAAWQIVQLDSPDDFIISTGELHTPREFISSAFHYAGLREEEYIRINDQLKRPSEVGILTGDYSKAARTFGYQPRTQFDELVTIIVGGEKEQEEVSRSRTSAWKV